MNTKKINLKMLLFAVIAAALLSVSVTFLAKGAAMNAGDSGLPMDVSGYDVSKMYTDGEEYLIGTFDGFVLCYDREGGLLWSARPFGDTTVNDLKFHGGKIFAAFGNKKILSFPDAAALPEDLANDPASQIYNLQDVAPSEMSFGGGSYFGVQGTDNEFGYLCLLPVSPDTADLAADGTYRLFAHDLYKQSRQIQTFTILGDDTVYYTTLTSYLSRLTVSDGSLIDEEIVKFTKPLLGVAATGEGLSAVNADGSLFVFSELPTPEQHAYLAYALDFGKEATGASVCGENFLVSLKNGGVAGVDTSARKVNFRINSSAYSSIVMSAEDSFLMRYYKTGDPVSLSYYTYSYASSMQALDDLMWLFVTGTVLFGILFLFFGCSSYRPAGAAIRAKLLAFGRALKTYRVIYLSLIPTFALLAVFYYFPIVFGFTLSFTDYLPNEHMLFAGFDNFVSVIQNEIFLKSIVSMLVFLGSDLLKAIIPPILFAEAIFAVRNKQFSFWTRALLFIPGILPGVAGSLVWAEGIFGANQNGLINALGKLFVPSFMNVNFFGSGSPLAIFSLIMFGFPWIGSYLIFYGAITGVPSSMYEAAKLDGCGWWRRIVSLDLPLILPQIKYIFITSFIASIQNYSTIYVVLGTGGPVYTPALLMYSEVMNSNYGTASAMSIFLFLFLMIATFLNFRMQSDKTA